MRALERDILVSGLCEIFLHCKIRQILCWLVDIGCRCYFTYKVGYVICDTTLGPEAAQREMEVGGGQISQAAMSWRDKSHHGFSLRPGDAIKIFVWPGQTSNDWYSSTTWKETHDFWDFMTKWSKKGLHLHSEFLASKIPQISTESIRICKSVSSDFANLVSTCFVVLHQEDVLRWRKLRGFWPPLTTSSRARFRNAHPCRF